MSVGEMNGALEQFERDHVRPKSGRTLIVGSRIYVGREDRRKRYPEAVGVDAIDGEGVDIVFDLENPDAARTLGNFEHVECCSVLEHSQRPWLLAQTIEACMLPGATLFVAVPFIWRIHAYPDDYWRMTPAALTLLFPRIEWQTLKLASHRLFDGPALKAHKIDGYPYLPRTETVGFGVRA